ncbi:hypothetical protein [Allohahella marinimesophila]|uniref:Lipoprotein n=1 Tax=Allohahella marinimesophila TaxID=1054972 RepID=A0ABP7NIB7_9GAMM
MKLNLRSVLCAAMSFVLIGSLVGCKTMRGDKVAVQMMPIVELEEAPGTKAQDTDNFRVIVTDIKSDFDSTLAPNLHKTLFGTLGRIITESGAERVRIERQLRTKLEDEFKRIEMEGRSEYTSPKAANLAISGELTTATITTSYDPEPLNYDFKKGKFVKGPAECTYNALVEGALNFYTVNPVQKIESVAFSGTDSSTLPATYNGCPDFNPTQAQNLFSETLNKTMKAESHRVKSLMAASGSVVMAHHDAKNNKYYFRTSISPSAGAVVGATAEFIEVQNIAGIDEEFTITSGEIVCTTLSNKYSFVELDGTQIDGRIQKGTKVKLSFAEGTDIFTQLGLPQTQSGC